MMLLHHLFSTFASCWMLTRGPWWSLVARDWMFVDIVVVRLLSHVKLCDPVDYRTPGFPVPDYLLEFAQIHVHWVSDAIQPSLCHPLLLLPLIFPSIRVFSDELALCLRWPKYWSFSISTSNGYSGLISFRIDWFDLLAAKGLSRVLSNTTIQKHQFFIAQPSLWSNSHTHTWLLNHVFTYVIQRITVLTIWTFVCKVMSLLFDMLSRLVIAFFQGVSIF